VLQQRESGLRNGRRPWGLADGPGRSGAGGLAKRRGFVGAPGYDGEASPNPD
jgi:hypothetical protein